MFKSRPLRLFPWTAAWSRGTLAVMEARDYELETRSCACGCGREFRCLPTSQAKHFCALCRYGKAVFAAYPENWGFTGDLEMNPEKSKATRTRRGKTARWTGGRRAKKV